MREYDPRMDHRICSILYATLRFSITVCTMLNCKILDKILNFILFSLEQSSISPKKSLGLHPTGQSTREVCPVQCDIRRKQEIKKIIYRAHFTIFFYLINFDKTFDCNQSICQSTVLLGMRAKYIKKVFYIKSKCIIKFNSPQRNSMNPYTAYILI